MIIGIAAVVVFTAAISVRLLTAGGSNTGPANAAATHPAGARAAPAKVHATSPAKVHATETTAPPSAVRIMSLFSEEPAGQMVAFGTSGGQLRYDDYTTAWHGPDVLPGTLRADSPIVLSPDGEDVFYFEPNGDIVDDEYVPNSGWQSPRPVGGVARAGSGLALFPGGAGSHPALFFVTTQGKLAYDDYTTAWHGPDVLPGTLRADSPIVLSPDGEDVFYFEPNGNVVDDDYEPNSGWSGPWPVGGAAQAGSGLALFPGGNTNPAVVFVAAQGKLAYDDYSAASGWGGPHPLPGSPRTGSPVVWNEDGTSFYFIESNGQVGADNLVGSRWRGPEFTGGTAARGSALNYAQETGTTSRPNLTFIDSHGVLADYWYAGGWHGPDPLPGT
jgi:hypothetical protein